MASLVDMNKNLGQGCCKNNEDMSRSVADAMAIGNYGNFIVLTLQKNNKAMHKYISAKF